MDEQTLQSQQEVQLGAMLVQEEEEEDDGPGAGSLSSNQD